MNKRGQFVYDYNFTYHVDWKPEGCSIYPWFLLSADKKTQTKDTLESVMGYRTDKLEFIRKQLQGIDQDQVLKDILDHIWRGTPSNLEKFKKLVSFVQRMMVHPTVEQPMESNATSIFRGLNGESPTVNTPPYPEDLVHPWLIKANHEAVNFGNQLGVWCNPLNISLAGDWGMAGMVHRALELLLLHEGRCGHQACVIVQLAQAAGWRARLVQVNQHRVAEVYVDSNWILADPDLLAIDFIGTTEKDDPASIAWCIENSDKLKDWPMRYEVGHNYGYGFYYKK